LDLIGEELDFIEKVDQNILREFSQILIIIYDMSNLHAVNFLQAGGLQKPGSFGRFVIRSAGFATGVADAGSGWIF